MVNKPKRYERVFWIEVDKIRPNPMQPRRDFDEMALASLTDSIRQYGVLQPLVVTRIEKETPAGVDVSYELISGERRWRASRRAGLTQVPVVVRDDEEDKLKLELAIIENLQREDLNPVDRAMAFKKLAEEFNLRHHEVATRVGKSREYVTNTIRLLNLPVEIQQALVNRQITEGHARPILMASDNTEGQIEFFKEIVAKKMNVRMAERVSRSIAIEKARKPADQVGDDVMVTQMERNLSETLGGIVKVEKVGLRGRVMIEFFNDEDLNKFLSRAREIKGMEDAEKEAIASNQGEQENADAILSDTAVIQEELPKEPDPEEVFEEQIMSDLFLGNESGMEEGGSTFSN